MLASARRPETERQALLEGLPPADLIRLAHDWLVWARDDQLPPPATIDGRRWRTWLILGGRGAGKTRTGAEWVRALALGIKPLVDRPARRIALIGATIAQVRSVMIEGVSGLLAIHPAHERPILDATRGELQWPNGAKAQMFAAADAEGLRGPQFDAAWCDELAKWRKPVTTWDNLQLALRLGEHPLVAITTTPRGLPLLKRIIADPETIVSRSRTIDNAANLSSAFLASMERRYGGTALGRQELEGEVMDSLTGGMWRREWIDAHRLQGRPELTRIVVALDPPVTSNAGSDACGIVVAGLGADKRAYVLADRTIRGREPIIWARAAIAAYRDFEADRIVAEVNQGGDLVVSVLRQVDPNVPVTKVYATRGKHIRAEPVATLYAEGRVAHVGEHALLEAELTGFAADGLTSGKSPDRLDALVWAITDLMLSSRPEPMIRPL